MKEMETHTASFPGPIPSFSVRLHTETWEIGEPSMGLDTYMIVQAWPNMDGTLTFTHVCVVSSRTVLEHHRSFTPFISVLIAAELY